jgi:hypothetical protein
MQEGNFGDMSNECSRFEDQSSDSTNNCELFEDEQTFMKFYKAREAPNQIFTICRNQRSSG